MPSKRESSPSESGEWMSVSEACRYICAILGVEKDRALLELARSARDGKVKARCSDVAAWARTVIIWPGEEDPPISWRSIETEEWDIAYWLSHSGIALPGIDGLIEFKAHHVFALCDREVEATAWAVVPRRRAGRKPKFDWDTIIAEVIYRVRRKSAGPANISEFTEEMLDWCSQTFREDDIPEKETLRPRIAKWVAKLPDWRD